MSSKIEITLVFDVKLRNLDNDDVLTTLRELGFVICRALIAYHAILKYHSEEEDREKINEHNKSNNNAIGKEGID